VVAIIVAAAAAFIARPRIDREVHLVARDMTYYVEGSRGPNPTLHLRAGELVRLVLTNDDAGMKHDLVVDDWHAATDLVASGRVTSVTLRVPARGARAAYHCTPHEETMRGTIVVE
jgi:plastocyanin